MRWKNIKQMYHKKPPGKIDASIPRQVHGKLSGGQAPAACLGLIRRLESTRLVNQKEDQGNDTCIEARHGMFSGSDFFHGNTIEKVKGLSVIDVSITKIEASGYVYNLEDLDDFAGTYSRAEAGITFFDGASTAILKNEIRGRDSSDIQGDRAQTDIGAGWNGYSDR